MSRIRDLADELLDRSLAADPISATYAGVVGHDAELTDYSVSGFEARAAIERDVRARMVTLEPESAADGVTKRLVLDRIDVSLAAYDSGDHFYELAHVISPAQSIRSVFDQMSTSSKDDWQVIALRMQNVPTALTNWQKALSQAMSKGHQPPESQVLPCIEQARAWAGLDAGIPPFFSTLASKYEASPGADRKTSERLRSASSAADAAFVAYAEFLERECAPHMTSQYAVGEERYQRGVRLYSGAEIDLDEVYAWGWDEYARLSEEIRDVCQQIKPGATLDEVKSLLDCDHEHWLHGEHELVDWLQGLLERAITELDGKHFAIAPELHRFEVRVAPPGGPAAPYYTAPSEDMSRPGIYWYPAKGRTRFPMWVEISTAYHEGVPGHHLQNGVSKMASHLSRYQRNLFLSGHGEGWALYAERLMDELGYLDRPEYRLDMLLNNMFRAARVVIDIGMHLQKSIPATQAFHGGETWTPQLASEFLLANTNLDPVIVTDEITRYLGWPAQAISYKLGEREWMRAREEAKARDGAAFDLKKWHADALSLGALGLDQLRSELAQL